jgi:hypothetical protein
MAKTTQESIERLRKNLTTHGLSKTPEYHIWYSAKRRAAAKGLVFNLTIKDIVIPPVCPVLGIPLIISLNGTRGGTYCSPTLDRIDPQGGYTKDNVWVISQKANTIKYNATLADLKAVVTALEEKRWLRAT